MNLYTDTSPIIACSTGTSSNTAIAVIRLSGFADLLDLQPFFSFDLNKTKKRFSHLTNILQREHILDNGLLVFFPEGESYTGENVLELSIHGNQLNIDRILRVFIENAGFRVAGAGEFTYRALKNQKLSLSQVEGLDMLLNASSHLMLSQGLDILQGELHAQYQSLYESFLKLKAAIELSIDFSEDVGEEESRKLFVDSLNRFSYLLDSLHERTQGDISSLLSPEVVLVGQTNAGKSSLFNLLIRQNRSIVSNIAGTTRDYISEVVHIDGTNFKLVDTAGFRESSDVIENIGIDRAFEILNRAFFRILIVNPFETNTEYLKKLYGINFDLLLISHSDKFNFPEEISKLNLKNIHSKFIASASFETGSIGPISIDLLNGPIEPVSKLGPIEPVCKPGPIEPVSKFGPIEPVSKLGPIEPVGKPGPIEPLLRQLISQKFHNLSSKSPILLDRHRQVINNLYFKKEDFLFKIKDIEDVAILSSEVNIFSNYITELIGIVSPDDVLNSIFSNFCIGK